MITYEDLICGDKFKTLWTSQFIKTDYVFDHFNTGQITHNKIVTHNSDYPIDSKYEQFADNVSHWFGVNVTINHTKFTPIPIGLENDYLDKAVTNKRNIVNLNGYPVAPTKLLYINHSVGTNPTERKIPYELFKTDKYVTVQVAAIPQLDYYEGIREHVFTLSPPGNGVDCHRTWEILYLGRVPILKKVARLQELYSDLPVVFINSYDELTQEFLVNKQEELRCKQFNYEKLRFSYWEQLIEES